MSTEVAEIVPDRQKKTRKRKTDTGYDKTTAQMVALAAKQVPPHQIAQIVGLPTKVVNNRIQKFRHLFKELKNVPDYRANRSELLDATELLALKQVSRKMDTGTLREAVYAFDKVFTAGRLTRGESTANHSHIHKFTDTQLLDIAKK